MKPEPNNLALAGWLSLAGAVVVVVLGWYLLTDDGVGAKQIADKRLELERLSGREGLDDRIKAERAAVENLRGTIEELKKSVGFTIQPRFQVPVNSTAEKERQAGYFFKQRLVAVRAGLRSRAFNRSIEFDESLGFGTADAVPPDEDAPYLLTMLQLTEKAVDIVLKSPNPVTRFSITHDKAIETGPVSRPILLREYPLTLIVTGGLEDLLAILHALSQVDANEPGDFPLILQGMSIDSEKLEQRDQIVQLRATFRIAGMQFLKDEERGRSASASPNPVRSADSSSSGSASSRETTTEPFSARP